MVEIVDPKPGMSVYDPTAGSGGMLIQSRDYIRDNGGDPHNLTLAGQESIGTTWSICRMNMILHDIPSADIRQEDTIAKPQHRDDNGELTRYDRVLANPPFSQNYNANTVEFPGRFSVWMPQKGKKADLMFVQHMLAVLKNNGRMATIMPHGVLFRGGEEKEARKLFIERGWLDAVIGLPPSLFYGTGIPACILVMNKEHAAERKDVLFVNADREYREGNSSQNFLRPEDMAKIVQVYRRRADAPGYARVVPVEDIAAEDFNCNIRRYVDNAPPARAAGRPGPYSWRRSHGRDRGARILLDELRRIGGSLFPAARSGCGVLRYRPRHRVAPGHRRVGAGGTPECSRRMRPSCGDWRHGGDSTCRQSRSSRRRKATAATSMRCVAPWWPTSAPHSPTRRF
jgi:type I restriction-modification system DNA methylase subunit